MVNASLSGMHMPTEFGIVDLFAGPGGLAEGFSSIRGRDGSCPFRIALSIEKELSAFETLRLRSFFRQFCGNPPSVYYQFVNGRIPEPDWKALFPNEWDNACRETVQLELGSSAATSEIDARLAHVNRRHGKNIVLIGGPPCQAYSLVGRARNKGNKGYEASNDQRHFLYREYIRIVKALMPAAFVMENVKGLLSSSVNGVRVFEQVLDDLSNIGGGSYKLVPLAPRSEQSLFGAMTHPPASDFVVRAEDYGIPQSRHRVIIVGIRTDCASWLNSDKVRAALLPQSDSLVTVRDVLKGMPRLRSGLSGGEDSEGDWRHEAARLMQSVSRYSTSIPNENKRAFRDLGERMASQIARSKSAYARSGGDYAQPPHSCPPDLRRWLTDKRLTRFPNNETRGHMIADLRRYFFAALYGRVIGVSPKADAFPHELAPDHRNWKTGKFADRFRVQLWSNPASTITSHISKDGHYFIHPDPAQCRSLTVREAARLQTFPDNYFFKGNRTQQFVQVGNAVPPFLAYKIAKSIHRLLLSASNRRSMPEAG